MNVPHVFSINLIVSWQATALLIILRTRIPYFPYICFRLPCVLKNVLFLYLEHCTLHTQLIWKFILKFPFKYTCFYSQEIGLQRVFLQNQPIVFKLCWRTVKLTGIQVWNEIFLSKYFNKLFSFDQTRVYKATSTKLNENVSYSSIIARTMLIFR